MTTAVFPPPTTATRTAAPARVPWGPREWTMLRWAVRATLLLGVAASVAANVLHAQPNPISQAIAAWPPLALLFTVELIARVPVHRRGLAVARLLAATTIAGIAAFVSYWHMMGVAARYGETGASPYLLPLSVDGLIIVASISLVEISGRLHATRPSDQPTTAADAAPPPGRPVVPRTGTTQRLTVSETDTAPRAPHRAVRRQRTAQPVARTRAQRPQARSCTAIETALADTAPTLPVVPPSEPAVRPIDAAAEPPLRPADVADQVPEPETAPVVPRPISDGGAPPAAPEPQPGNSPDDDAAAQSGSPAPTAAPENPHDDAGSPNEVPAAPREAIAYWQRRDPGIGIDDLAARVGKSPRQIRRYLRQPAGDTAKQVNGHRNDTLADTFRSPRP